jgi:hypothetical protein
VKFLLAPYNRDLSDDVLLDDLRAVAHKFGKPYVTKDTYNEHGRLSASALQKRFGSWSKAHELAGLRKIRHYDATAEDCISDLKAVATKIGKTMLTTKEYKPHGRYCIPVIARRCGSFKAALERAGLSCSPRAYDTLTDNQLFENLERLWETLGRQPTKNDYFKPLSWYSYAPYIRRFGSYRKALEAFVASFEAESLGGVDERSESTVLDFSAPGLPARHRTSRNVPWRLRFLVMRRDRFKCRLCGASPALQAGTVLVVDHMKSWESGGETVIENLQTLCEPCNGGKSNLPLVDV